MAATIKLTLDKEERLLGYLYIQREAVTDQDRYFEKRQRTDLSVQGRLLTVIEIL
jgi:hypothetical protein